jgi:hypothetical protein
LSRWVVMKKPDATAGRGVFVFRSPLYGSPQVIHPPPAKLA